MGLFSAVNADAVLLNRLDANEILGTCSKHGFELEERVWLSAEHYYQASKYQGALRDKIRQCDNPEQARKLGRSIWRRKRSDWKKVRDVIMTRAMYCKCKAHGEVEAALLDTEDRPLANNAYGEYYWGIGRDGRGQNRFGKILQNVRNKLREEKLLEERKLAGGD